MAEKLVKDVKKVLPMGLNEVALPLPPPTNTHTHPTHTPRSHACAPSALCRLALRPSRRLTPRPSPTGATRATLGSHRLRASWVPLTAYWAACCLASSDPHPSSLTSSQRQIEVALKRQERRLRATALQASHTLATRVGERHATKQA